MSEATSLRTPWTAEDYSVPLPSPDDDQSARVGVTGSGAHKLASSAVAPLVAAARGYRTYTTGDVKAVAGSMGITGSRRSDMNKLADLVPPGSDCMVMPWHRVDSRVEDDRVGMYVPATHQFKPHTPRVAPDGRPIKYDTFAGVPLPLDLNPAVPAERITSSSRVAIVEGLIKADSLLSAYLLEHVADPTELAWPPAAEAADFTNAARDRLRQIIEATDPDQVPLIVAIAGSGNWHNHPEWDTLSLRDREVWAFFDGDVTTNPDVWRQADKMFDLLTHKRANPMLVDLSRAETGDEKLGIDDFLAFHGTVADLYAGDGGLVIDRMPQRPDHEDDQTVGTWRINPRTWCAEEWAEVKTKFGESTGETRWETRTQLGGRLKAVGLMREPTPDEEATGVLDMFASNDADITCEIEIMWKDPATGTENRHTVTGPAGTLLSESPAEWHRRGGRIPAQVLMHPEWPPRKGQDWLAAIKAFDGDGVVPTTAWTAMGWVPTQAGQPAFVVGEHAIDAAGYTDRARSAVTEDLLSGASRFGVWIDPDHAPGTPERDALMREDVHKVLNTFVRSGAWTRDYKAAGVLAAALRPIVPIRSRVSMFLVGPKRGGKSWTAAAIMSAWQSRPGAFHEDSLTGSAEDTPAAIEHALSIAPIWVADDFAPAADAKKASANLDLLGRMVRSVHNMAARRRMNADMTSRRTKAPRALFIVSAENDHSIASVRDRMVTLRIERGDLGSDESVSGVVDMRTHTGEVSRVAGYLVQWIARTAQRDGWEHVMWRFQLSHDELVKVFTRRMSRRVDFNTTRYARLAADLALGLSLLFWVADSEEVAVDDDDAVLIRRLRTLISDLVLEQHADRDETSPGQAMLEALAKALAAGHAHVASAADPAAEPLDSKTASSALGWVSAGSDGALRPSGARVGLLVTSHDGLPAVLLDEAEAMKVASRAYPDLVPAGSSGDTVWRSADSDGLLASESVGNRNVTGSGRPRRAVRVRSGGHRLSGTPVMLSVLLGQTEDEAPEQ